ncbi:hypothetical protein M7I_3122 [Glarea lozoyensis 74030]|uniref:Uncharacterized protein n=1 Tax=Glarea lozoyensis (strain ATCC 74030 / MF5533) TaxID=1104152 RepID=H0EKM3_GLAL7|nr:hypothetical protein M7I_3122 [Glarea lozoyensis 74030]
MARSQIFNKLRARDCGGKQQRVDCRANCLVEHEFDEGVRYRQLGLEDLVFLLFSVEFLIVVCGCRCYRGWGGGCVGRWEGGFEELLPAGVNKHFTLGYKGKSTYHRKFGGVFSRLKNMNWRMGVQSIVYGNCEVLATPMIL